MIQANHPRFSCTSDIPLTINAIIFSGPLVHTDTPSGTGVISKLAKGEITGDWFESRFIRNLDDRFCRVDAQIVLRVIHCS